MRFFKKNKRTVLQRIVNAATFGAFISLGAVLSQYHVLFDLISHFRIQYILLLIPGFIFAAYAKKTRSLLVISVALAIHAYTVTMSMLPLSAQVNEKAESVEITVLSANLLVTNDEYKPQLDLIREVNPDILALQEFNSDWEAVLLKALPEYPYRAVQPASDSFGIALYSKFPIVSGGIEELTRKNLFSVNVSIDLGDKLVQVLVVHPPPPMPGGGYQMRNEQMQRFAEIAADHDGPLIIMGDFNATPWTSHFTQMESVGKLRNARAGHGFHPTYPNRTIHMHMLIPIDHILVNSQIAVEHFDSKEIRGSDHRNIWSRLHVY